MPSKGDTLSNGDTLALVQAGRGVVLRRMMVAPGGNSADVLEEWVDSTGTVVRRDSGNGVIAATSITGSGVAGAASGSLPGLKAPVISGLGTTRALLATESGSTVLFDRGSTGTVVTLPAPAVGLFFDFIVTTNLASSVYEIDTDAGTTFLLGNVNSQIDATATDKAFFGNGTSHVKVQMNGSTTGGIKGTQLRFTCVAATIWQVTGMVAASGVLATPFA